MFDIAVRELASHRTRTILTAMGIFIAITAIVSLGSISTGLNELVTSTTGSIGADTIFVMKHFDMSDMSGPPGSQSIEDISAEEVAEISKIPGIKRAVPVISRQIGGMFEVDGIDIDDMDMFGVEGLEFEEGMWPDNDEKGAVLGKIVANSFDVTVGDTILLNKKEVEVVGIFEGESGSYDLVVLVPYEYANEIYEADRGATQIMLEPVDISMVDSIKSMIEDEHEDLDAMTMEDALSMMEEMTGTLNIMTFGIGFITSLVAAIGIIITMYTSVVERRQQIGIMKATGAYGRTILIQILEEGLVISLASSLLALVVSFFFVDMINNVLLGGASLALITPELAIGAVMYGVILTMLASLYPARIAVRTDPIKAIRGN
ncbi:MAG: ABC transporter permease [Candidatus Aenigmarchaeota archaeon]|nr:ABC transporter permease [Candidatus Aenigmarchaeota archaeon]